MTSRAHPQCERTRRSRRVLDVRRLQAGMHYYSRSYLVAPLPVGCIPGRVEPQLVRLMRNPCRIRRNRSS
jgi:hypothetical protein